MTRLFLIIAFLALGIVTGAAFLEGGLLGFWEGITFSYATLQIYLDLVIAIGLIAVWIYRDARAAGRNPWPWIIAAFIVGVFSPLVYLLTRGDQTSAA